jgi:anti-repressor protein
MNKLQIFSYNDAYVRTVENDGEIWWVLKDVCDILELSNPTSVAERLDDDERSKFDLGRQGETNIINESGLYNVIFTSNKPEAKQFKRWVTHEVLPSIRKTGGYNTQSVAPMTDSERIRLSNHYIKLSKLEHLDWFGKHQTEYIRKAIEIMEGI